MTAQEATWPPLEPYVSMPKGGVAPRCQRVKRDGEQCGRAARAGHRTCGVHGAGYGKREERGERKRPGRPVTHGMYSTIPNASFADVMVEVATLEDVLTSSDSDLLALKAVLVYKLGELEAFAPKAQALEAELTRLDAQAQTLDPQTVTPAEAMRFTSRMAALRRPVSQLSKLIDEVADLAIKSIRAHELRAATDAKLAEAQAVEAALEVSSASRTIWHALAGGDKNMKDALDDAMRRRLCGPRHLELPPLMQLDFVVEPLLAEEAPSR